MSSSNPSGCANHQEADAAAGPEDARQEKKYGFFQRENVGNTWETPGKHLGNSWEIAGKHLGIPLRSHVVSEGFESVISAKDFWVERS